MLIHLANYIISTSGCTNLPNYLLTTALVDSATNVSLLKPSSPSKVAATQLPTKTIIQPEGARMVTTNTLELLLSKLPVAAREAHEAPTITNNLISVSVLCDAGCKVFSHAWL